jgi:hypothetical protein
MSRPILPAGIAASQRSLTGRSDRDDQASKSDSTRGGFVTNPAVGAAIV